MLDTPHGRLVIFRRMNFFRSTDPANLNFGFFIVWAGPSLVNNRIRHKYLSKKVNWPDTQQHPKAQHQLPFLGLTGPPDVKVLSGQIIKLLVIPLYQQLL